MSNFSAQLGSLSPEKRRLLELRLTQKGISTLGMQTISRRKETGPCPLSFAQQRLWLLDQLEPRSTAYLIPHAQRFLGYLSCTALEQSLSELIHRHESLRTTFEMQAVGAVACPSPVQIIHPAGLYTLPVIDLQGLRQEREQVGQQLLRQEAQRSCDLVKGPLLRTYLLRLQEQEHILLLTLHHIITDGWSNGVLVRELTTLYQAKISGSPSPVGLMLPPLPIQYADYALWQREYLMGEVLEAQLSYWRKQLADMSPLELPTDHPRPTVQTYRGAIQSQRLPEALSLGLMTLSQREHVTLFMTLLAAFQVLLARYSGETDIAVGTPIANRTRPELANMIGFLVNTLVMRSDLSGNPTFVEVLTRVRKVCLDAYANPDIPFEKIVEELEPERDLSRSPLFQVMFVLQNAPRGQEELAGVSVKQPAVESTTAKFDLTLSASETAPGRLRLAYEYNTDLFEAETITRMLTHFQTLLEGIVQDPQVRISDLPLLTEAERHQILVEWNTTKTDYPQDRCVHQLFEEQVQCTPDTVALVFEDKMLTYAHLNQRANRLAHFLQDLGIGPDRLVGVCMERCIEMVIALLAVLKAGGAYVPLDPTYPQQRLTSLIQDAQVVILLTQSHLHERLRAKSITILDLDLEREGPESHPVSTIQPDHLVYLIYTSGSTGQPKGVMNTHRGLCNRLLWMQQTYQLTPQDRLLQKTPLSFDVSVWECFWALLTGASLIIARPGGHLDPTYLRMLIVEQQVTTLHFVPSMLQAFLLEPGLQSCSSLRQVMCSGEALSVELQTCFFVQMREGVALHNLYGPTEAAIDVTFWPCQRGSKECSVPIGCPIANTQIYLLDRDLQPVPIGVTGELFIGGVALARGYARHPKLTAAKFIVNPFGEKAGARIYRTGDLARYRADGAIEYLGRIDQQVKLRGFRIELGEIEAALREVPIIQECVVVLREDVPEEKRLVAYLVVEPGHPLEQAHRLLNGELRAFLQDRLPTYMIPSRFVPLQVFPLTPNGKLDRGGLPAPEEEAGKSAVPEGSKTPIEDVLVGIFCEVLGRRHVGIDENFFELGGHSLLSTQLVARVRAVLNVELPLRAVFEAPTVAGLAQRIEQTIRESQRVQLPPLVPMIRPEVIPLSFAQQRLWFLNQLQPGSTAYLVPQAHHLHGPLSARALERSLEELVHRHESLRTTFTAHAGQPMQIIHPASVGAVPCACPLPLIDLHALSPEHKKREVRQLLSQEAQCPCDLENGPLLRTYLLQLDPEEHVLMITLHHIITDGWSNQVLLRELTTFYHAQVSGMPPSLAPLPIQYADYALWQRAFLQGEVFDAQLDYWMRQLGGVSPIELPTDYPRPSIPSSRGAIHSFVLPGGLLQALYELSQQLGVTLFMTLLAAFQILLYRSTGQSDIVVGTDSANRNHVEMEGIIGFFVNLLALRTDLSGKPTFREVLKRVREVVLGAYTHQDTPFELLVEKLAPDRHLDQTPLVQALFVLQNMPGEPERPDNPALHREHAGIDQSSLFAQRDEETICKFDLALFMQERAGSLSGILQYRLDLFKAETIASLVVRFLALLQHSVKQPDIPIYLLSLTQDGESVQQERREIKQKLHLTNDGWFDLSS